MKTSDIFGNVYHLQRRRRNAGRPYKRHSTLIRWYAKELRVHKPNTDKAFDIIGRLFTHEARYIDN